MRKRVNTLDWSTAEVLTKKMAEVQIELMRRQKYTLPHETLATNGGYLHGDSNVMVALINLKKYVDAAIEKSVKVNG